MECREVRQLAEAFVSEQLLVETTEAIVTHLERCPSCRAEIEGLRRLRTATRSAFARAPELMMRPEFTEALTSRLKAEAAGRQTGRLSRRAWLAMAASILVVASAGWEWRQWSVSGALAMLQAAIGDHRFCAVKFRLTERPISLEEAARRYDGADGRLASVEPATTNLTGGPLRILERHSCVYSGRRFAHIVLRYKNETVSLLVTEDRRPGGSLGRALAGTTDTLASLPATDGFHVASFHAVRHAVFVVSSLDDQDVQEVAQAMLAPISRALAGV